MGLGMGGTCGGNEKHGWVVWLRSLSHSLSFFWGGGGGLVTVSVFLLLLLLLLLLLFLLPVLLFTPWG